MGRRELAFITQPGPRENWTSFLGLAPCQPQHPKDPVLRPAGAPGQGMAEGVAVAGQEPGRPRPAHSRVLLPRLQPPPCLPACLPPAGVGPAWLQPSGSLGFSTSAGSWLSLGLMGMDHSQLSCTILGFSHILRGREGSPPLL